MLHPRGLLDFRQSLRLILVFLWLLLLGVWIFQHLEELLEALCDGLAHKLPARWRKGDILFFLGRVVAAHTGLDCIAMRDLSEKDSSGCCPLPV
jgi:hypothetical protein